MLLKGNTINYEWQANWGSLNGEATHSHGGIVEDSKGNYYLSFNDAPYVRVFDKDGNQLRSFDGSGKDIHCLTVSKDSEGEWLWDLSLATGKVTKSTLDGIAVKSISREDFNLDEGERFGITAMTIDPQTNNLWVTDGYGRYSKGTGGNKVYCFNQDLELQFSFDGTEAECGSLQEPHWIIADTRKDKTEIYIADRANNRIVIYSNEGKFLRTIEQGLITPSGFSIFEDKLVCVELKGRLHIIDINDNIIETFADGSEYTQIPGWPNRLQDEKGICPLPCIEEGKFNSPHGVYADKEGNIIVHEWLLGIRITKLKKVS